MSKRALWSIILLSIRLFVSAQTSTPVILEIGLIDSENYRGASPPARLIVGIDMSQEALYKLSHNDSPLKGGRFFKGFNSFSLEADIFFQKSGIHLYRLELKIEDRIVKHTFEIIVEMEEKTPPPEKETTAKDREYSVLMYIGDQLVASSKKLPAVEPPKKIELPPPPYQIDPYASAAEPDYNVQGVPILAVAMALYQSIKALTAKKDREAPPRPIQKKSKILATFLRSGPDGQIYKAKATISLRTPFR
jgi:hypothetical protein